MDDLVGHARRAGRWCAGRRPCAAARPRRTPSRGRTASPSVPTTSTVSPSPKRPATSTTPGGQQAACGARPAPVRAPSSTMTDPATRAAKAIHSLRAGSLRRWASKRGARPASSATASASTPARAALAITVRTPDHDAIRAAASLLAMPPLPRSLPPRAGPIAAAGRRRPPGRRARRRGRRAGRPCTGRRCR